MVSIGFILLGIAAVLVLLLVFFALWLAGQRKKVGATDDRERKTKATAAKATVVAAPIVTVHAKASSSHHPSKGVDWDKRVQLICATIMVVAVAWAFEAPVSKMLVAAWQGGQIPQQHTYPEATTDQPAATHADAQLSASTGTVNASPCDLKQDSVWSDDIRFTVGTTVEHPPAQGAYRRQCHVPNGGWNDDSPDSCGNSKDGERYCSTASDSSGNPTAIDVSYVLHAP